MPSPLDERLTAEMAAWEARGLRRKLSDVDPAEAREVEAVPGAGLRGVVDEHVFLVGSPAWFEDQGIDARVLAVPMDAARQRGRSVVLVARDGAFVGFVAFETVQDVDARSTIAALTAMGVESRILSGDAPEAVAQMATHLGIPPGQPVLWI